MRRKLIVLIAALAATSMAAAGDMILARDGSLFKVTGGDDGLVVTHSAPGGLQVDHLVPQTAATVTSSLQVAIDEASSTIVVAWQEGVGSEARVLLAAYTEGTWQGPLVIAGSLYLVGHLRTRLVDDVIADTHA